MFIKVIIWIGLRLRNLFLKSINYCYLKGRYIYDIARLKNKKFTIICNTCIGGVIYNRLKQKFLTPTINTWISQTDFVKFITHLHEYLESDFYYGGIRENDNVPYGLLNGPAGEIKIYFVHYSSYNDGVEKWNERKKRINWNNLYIITSDGNGLTNEDIKNLEIIKCNNMVIFTSKKLPYKYTLCLKGYEKELSAASHMLLKHKILYVTYKWEDTFDYVTFLNTNIGMCR